MEYAEFRKDLSRAARELYRKKMMTAGGGNLSLRLPDGKGFLITPSGTFKGDLKPESMVTLDDRGRPVKENTGPPSMETGLHLHIYRLRSRVNAVIHSHAPASIVAGLYNMNIPPLTVEMTRFTTVPLIPYDQPGSPELASAVAIALEENPAAGAILLQNHGLVTAGESLREAIDLTLAMEEACRITILCRLLGGEPPQIPIS